VTPLAPPYVVGDIVRHTGEFLRSVGWFAGVPINGEVVAVENAWGGGLRHQLLTVRWSDGTEGGIASCSVEFWPRGRALTLQRRAARHGRTP
jgi:hypothetical protein